MIDLTCIIYTKYNNEKYVQKTKKKNSLYILGNK